MARFPRSSGMRLAALLAAAALAAACERARPVGSPAIPACERCHGGGGLGAAPPRSARGSSDPGALAVGAHERHLRAGVVSLPVPCDACHVVPGTVEGHVADAHATVTFGGPALWRDAHPQWDRAAATCSGVYCHGATLGAGGAFTTPVWTRVDGAQVTCAGCHGYPPPVPHPQGDLGARCHLCHGATVLDDDHTIDVAGGQHVDGAPDVSGGSCGACHGAPPASGAHHVHASLASPDDAGYGDLHVLEDVAAGGASYDFGCGHCHPLDAARHLDGRIDVALSPEGAPAGALKARNATNAAYSGGACDGVYCHSSGQASPAYRPTPAWTATGPLGCGGCHDNPPRYPTGAPGSETANSHLVLSSDGWESGHFGGLPGPWHGSRHGLAATWGEDAAPITCQTCHADTVDPAGAGPSGFYWLDTTGDYELPGGLLGYRCTDCHGSDPGDAPEGAGRVLPLRHVNGRADVAFDARRALPALAWLPPAPNTPTRPYWATDGAVPSPPVDAIVEGTTLSLHLGSARYDPPTKTCTNVGCHLAATEIAWGGANDWDACSRCHVF